MEKAREVKIKRESSLWICEKPLLFPPQLLQSRWKGAVDELYSFLLLMTRKRKGDESTFSFKQRIMAMISSSFLGRGRDILPSLVPLLPICCNSGHSAQTIRILLLERGWFLVIRDITNGFILLVIFPIFWKWLEGFHRVNLGSQIKDYEVAIFLKCYCLLFFSIF